MTTNKPFSGALRAAVDLGSNSFRLLIGYEEAGQIVTVSTHRETVRLAGGLDEKNFLAQKKIDEACAVLRRFRERIGNIPHKNVRAVATSTYRQATNREALLNASIEALGFDIDIISGQEEARLIYVGCAHTLPWSDDERLIIDIGGGSTEIIIGTRYEPEMTESFNIGAVNISQPFFPNGIVTGSAFRKAEVFVRSRLEVLQKRYKKGWQIAYGSSGTVRALHEIITQNNLGASLTVNTLSNLKQKLIEVGDTHKAELFGLKASRAPVIAGGLAILHGLMLELNIERIEPSEGALRLGVMYDLLNRSEHTHNNDPRTITVNRLVARSGASAEQINYVNTAAQMLWQSLTDQDSTDNILLWVAHLHEIGMMIAHEDYHHHSAYIIKHSDLYGFSEQERTLICTLVGAHTGSMRRLLASDVSDKNLCRLICIRLASLFCHSRRAEFPQTQLKQYKNTFELTLPKVWLAAHPLTDFLLEEEAAKWLKWGVSLRINRE